MTDDRPTSTALLRGQSLPCLLAILFITILVAGCGGGGGGGSSAPSIPATLTGTVDFAAGSPAAGYTVQFGGVSTTTDSQGTFQINFDAGQYSGNQTLSVLDTNNALIDKQTVSVNPSGGTQSVGTIDVGPPAPPPA